MSDSKRKARRRRGGSPECAEAAVGLASDNFLRSKRAFQVFRRLGLAHVAWICVLGLGAFGGIQFSRSHPARPSGQLESVETSGVAVAFVPQRPEFERIADTLFNRPNGIMDRTASTVLSRKLEAAAGDVRKRAPLYYPLTEALLREGQTEKAVQVIEELMTLIGNNEEVLRKNPELYRLRALTYLRLAEVSNCVRRHNGDCCVFPLREGGVHTEKAPALKAAENFASYLAIRPSDLTAQFLLNIAHMAHGTYPGGLAEQFLIPAEGPCRTADFPQFKNVAEQVGVTRLNNAGGGHVYRRRKAGRCH